jgi:hypothetical protein
MRSPQRNPFPRGPSTLALALACALAARGTAHAQEPAPAPAADARQLFQTGVTDYEAGHYNEALAEFQEAYRRKPHPLVLVNIANCYDKLNRPVEALEQFEAFLATAEGTPQQRQEIRGAIAELQKKIGRLLIRAVAPAQTRIQLDELETRTVGQPILLSVGQHRVVASAEGYETAVQMVQIRPQETTEIGIELRLLPPPPPPVALTPPAPPPPPAAAPPLRAPVPARSSQQTLAADVWIAGSATFVLGISAVVTGQLALAANREFEDNLSAVRNTALTERQRAGAWESGVDAANRANTLAAVTDVLLALTLVSGGLTTYFYLAQHEHDEVAAHPRVSAQLGPNGGRLVLQGRL